MPGIRDTNSDMGHSRNSSSKLNPTDVRNELRRLDRTKATQESVDFLDKKVDKMEEKVTSLSEKTITTGNKASEALRIALAAETSANEEHKCFHEQTIENINKDIESTTAKVDEWDDLFREFLLKQSKSLKRQAGTVVGATIVVAGALVTWLVMFASVVDDVSKLESDAVVEKQMDATQEDSINDLKKAIENKDVDNLQTVMTAFEKILDERDSKKAPKPTRAKKGRQSR